MPTLLLRVDPLALAEPSSDAALTQAAAILRAGGTVAFPTETVYGLGANALDPLAVAAIFTAKRRPGWDPLIVHVSDQTMLSTLVTSISQPARTLMSAFWPGPLTLLLPRSSLVPDAVTANRPLVGIRMPQHPVAVELIRRTGLPLAAPSANTFGHTSPTTAQHVLDDLDGRIDAVIDAGPTAYGLESTVLDPNASPIVIYRQGTVTLDQIRAAAGPAELFLESISRGHLPQTDSSLLGSDRLGLPSPGIGMRHYAPNARLILIDCEKGKTGEGEETGIAAEALVHQKLRHEALRYAQDLGILWPGKIPNYPNEITDSPGRVRLYPWGQWSDADELARNLFTGLRWLDAQGCSVILCPLPTKQGIGAAIRDRLLKAAYPGN